MEDLIKMPKNAEHILHLLNESGYEAFIVGGCVRDSIMRKEPKDWDICTSALPEEMMTIFKNFKIIPTGLKHGTITLVLDNEQYEITTYRIDGEYEDNRHPKDVVFTKNLEQDLSRRDFTINAMAYNPKIGLVDMYGGKEDIKNGVIRCVGDADERFSEDALRILRAMRFAIRYNFIINLETIAAMKRCKYLLKNISNERITSELKQMLSSDGDSICFTFAYTADILKVVVPELSFIISDGWLMRLRHQNNLHTRMALFFDFKNPGDILRRMKFDNKTISSVSNIGTYGQAILWSSNEKYYAKWLLNRIGYTDAIEAVEYARTYLKVSNQTDKDEEYICRIHAAIQKAYFDKECYQLSSLNVNGNDVMKAGFKNKEVGKVLHWLLEMVMRENIPNDREILIKKMGEYGTEM